MATIEKLQILQFRNLNNQYLEPNTNTNLFIESDCEIINADFPTWQPISNTTFAFWLKKYSQASS